ncbi:hypothetical protein [Burkholderia plantarii]|uniref:hypothetical protein n=1 Tax=Burkholderia plantarii TaxID=41899 RepID=UPI00114CAD12|nr:hypothetical protein [Burkholderia plantarii]
MDVNFKNFEIQEKDRPLTDPEHDLRQVFERNGALLAACLDVPEPPWAVKSARGGAMRRWLRDRRWMRG